MWKVQEQGAKEQEEEVEVRKQGAKVQEQGGLDTHAGGAGVLGAP